MLAPFADDLNVIAACHTVEELIETCGEPPDVVILDVLLGRRTTPLATNVGRLRRWGTRVLAISTDPGRHEVAEAVKRLRLNFVAKADLDGDYFRTAIRETAADELVVSPHLMQAIVLNESGPELTEREKHVMRLLASGMPPKVVARRLGISEDTIRRHLASIRTKYRAVGRPVDNPVLLYYEALRDEIIADPDEIFDV